MGARPDEPDDASEPETGPHTDETSSQGSDSPTDNDRWAAIVADLVDLDRAAGPETRRDLDQHDWSGPAPDHGVTYPVAPWVADSRVVRPASGRDWDGTDQIDDAETQVDEDEHFVPPDPGPVLGGDPLLTMAWLAVVGMPLLLLLLVIAWRDAPAALMQATAAMFALGVAVLIWRMPHRRDGSDDDTGAVV